MVERNRDSIGPSPVLRGKEIRSPLMEEKKKQEEEAEDIAGLQEQLLRARRDIEIHPTEGKKETFERILTRLRNREKTEAQMSQVRSRIRWIQLGDAPSRYFFASLKAKQARENITILQTEEGGLLTDREEILGEIEQEYSTLYSADEEGGAIEEQRREILHLMNKRFTAEQNATIREVPDDALIEDTVKNLPRDKSPGIDGVVAEILRLGWQFMKQDCIKMVTRVWQSKKLLARDNRGVIKLIPKTKDLFWLRNWRPITLLTVTYKIIAKILATRLKAMVPGLVDRQQTGFLARRDITENVMSLRLAQEWAAVTGQEALFVKLDFQKAYDRISHRFLWATLAAVGLVADNIELIQGIVEGGFSQVHINGQFTKEFPLYADDTGISITLSEDYFTSLRNTVSRFEAVSGARLNLGKSLIMPLAPTTLPPWVYNTGCEVAEPGVNFRQFIWGWNDQNNPKTSLIAWERVAQSRDNGGLNWTRFRERAAAMHIKCVLNLLRGNDTEWACLANSLILRTLRDGAYQRERCQWGLEEILILTKLSKVRGSPTFTRILKSWNKAKSKVMWNQEEGSIPQHLKLPQAVILLNWGQGEGPGVRNKALACLKKGGIDRLTTGTQGAAADMSWTQTLQINGVFPEEEVLREIHQLEVWSSNVRLQPSTLLEAEGWEWADGTGRFNWRIGVAVWSKKLSKNEDFSELLNHKWNVLRPEDERLSWPRRWKLLWSIKLSYRKKIWLWKILQRGFFTGSRAAEMRVSEGWCDRCQGQLETLEHLLWDCRIARRRKDDLRRVGAIPAGINRLLKWIDEGLDRAGRDISYIAVTMNFAAPLWRERNNHIFNNKVEMRPTSRIIRETYREQQNRRTLEIEDTIISNNSVADSRGSPSMNAALTDLQSSTWTTTSDSTNAGSDTEEAESSSQQTDSSSLAATHRSERRVVAG
ncbi:hypothetical protein R1sor_002125 [Riccia sorocarpa]|uniref:Reverse transcriptase domain-containing protein n=1 Tax=Riccia sorocarpa TaxID=122646 RepID=A0ABD3GYA0_9MARC